MAEQPKSLPPMLTVTDEIAHYSQTIKHAESLGRDSMADQTKSLPPMLTMTDEIGHHSQTIKHAFGDLARPYEHPSVRGVIANMRMQTTAVALISAIVGGLAVHAIPAGALILLALAVASFSAMVVAGPVQGSASDASRVRRSVIRAGHRYSRDY